MVEQSSGVSGEKIFFDGTNPEMLLRDPDTEAKPTFARHPQPFWEQPRVSLAKTVEVDTTSVEPN